MDDVRVMTPAEWYETAAQDIADRAKVFKDSRLYIAERLAEMKKRAEENGDDWNDVLDAYVRPKLQLAVGEREVRRLLAIGSAPDPEKAMADERAKQRLSMAKSRTNVGPSRENQRLTAADRGPPAQRAIAAVQSLPEPERRAVVETLAVEVAPRALPAPPQSDEEIFIAAGRRLDDERLTAILIEEFWPRIGDGIRKMLARPAIAADGTEYDPVTDEVIEDAQRPSNRDVSAGGRPCPDDGPQANRPAKVAGVREPAPDQGVPADPEGHSREGAGHADEAAVGNQAGDPAPVRDSVPPAGLDDEDFWTIPEVCRVEPEPEPVPVPELTHTDEDPSAPDERPAAVKRVRA